MRQVERNDRWSLDHVTFGPGESSPLHLHDSHEILCVTKGFGNLISGKRSYVMQPSFVSLIPSRRSHRVINSEKLDLEYWRILLPPASVEDVEILDIVSRPNLPVRPGLPPLMDRVDGNRLMLYDFPDVDVCIAFGVASSEPVQNRRRHRHSKTEEWIHVLGGSGVVIKDGKSIHVHEGDGVKVESECDHCICSDPQDPLFMAILFSHSDEEDIYF